ncbi:MAG: hypothetical protein ABEJ05_02845 [Haloglomus sp.]
MTTRAVAEMREWDRRQYGGGFDGLHDLADREFSGAVEAETAVLYMLRGRVVGVFDLDEADEGADASLRPTDIETFERATGTAYRAPHAALPLLFAMQATGGEERGRYYTEDTPLEEVHERLTGGFTGYVELSENVLSGDYYSVYHGGRAKHVAFIGQSERLLEDEEAFERACDEVGIYTVTAVDLDIVDIPEVEGSAVEGDADAAARSGASSAAGATGTAAADAADTGPDADPDAHDSGLDTADTDDGTGDETAGVEAAEGSAGAEPADAGAEPADASERDTDPASEVAREPELGGGTTTEEDVQAASEPDDPATDAAAETAPSPDEPPADDDIEAAVTAIENNSAETDADGVDTGTEAVEADSAGPDAVGEPTVGTGESEEEGKEKEESDGTEKAPAAVPDETEAHRPASDVTADSDTAASETAPSAESAAETAADDTAALRRALEAREREVDRFEHEVDRLESALQEVRDERDDLAARVEQLEERLRDLGSGDAAPETAMTPEEALAGTSFFVRYRSKSEPTLDDLSADVSRERVVENIRLERHTEFDESAVAVDGRAFADFVEETQAFRFIQWLVTELPLEIRGTNSESVLRDLYDALPDIDRVEFDATVADRTFDLVARDRMGEPLAVVSLDDSRESTAEDEMVDLVQGASAVSEESASLAAAIAVTRAFFEPEALSTVDEATGGSLLSRDKRESYVKLSRGRGFHLCLVEDRDESFYLSVPEL